MKSAPLLSPDRFSLLLATQALIAVVLCLGNSATPLPLPGAIAHAWLQQIQDASLLAALWHSIQVLLLALLFASISAIAVAGVGAMLDRHNKWPALSAFLAWLVLSGACMRLYGGAFQPHLSLLVLGMIAMAITRVASLLESVPQQAIDQCRAMGMPAWRIALELVLLGKADIWLGLLRHNATTGWALLSLVEALSPDKGGIGALLFKAGGGQSLSHLLAIQLTILGYAFLQDSLLGKITQFLCPWRQTSGDAT